MRTEKTTAKSGKRQPISKKLRFEVFKRDGFVCQYCGKHPPDIILEVDHIHPKAKNGSDDINNLITSCFDCNRGKGKIELKQIPNSLSENKEILEEREKQYVEYHKLLAKIESRITREINEIDKVYQSYF
jgi:5-methylcytosine-specific restriction endonuclease McrA